MKKIALVFISTLFGMVAFCQELPDNPEDNSCYVKRILPSEYEEEILKFPVYLGDDFDQGFLDTITIVLEDEERKWESKIHEGCRAKNEEDCYVWCWMDVPAVTETIIIVDTTQTKDFIYEYYTKKILIRGQRERTEFVKVPCETITFVIDLQRKLKKAGFYGGEVNGIFDSETRRALNRYRRLYKLEDLDINIDEAWLRELGIAF